jgi:hypothetical protein
MRFSMAEERSSRTRSIVSPSESGGSGRATTASQ